MEDVRRDLLLVENPARYCGGEFHYGTKEPDKCSFHAAICFPDLYEIGMSNHAVRILYDIMNRMEGVFCDRVFAVAKDYEAMLREKKEWLSTLDERRPLKELDFLGISIGYELCATNILQILELGGIPLHAEERKGDDPIVICGGPATTNPLPFIRFFDFAYIGEAENGLTEVVRIIKEGKEKGRSRPEIVDQLKTLDFLWCEGKNAARSFDMTFSAKEDKKFKYYVVPNFAVAQDNGIVEIMRGCPNGCRFCNAGQYYKPYRQKSQSVIMEQVEQNVHDFGFREITLSSLSSGDYPHIKELIANLNATYMCEHVSFSLPSLKVSTFNLDVLEQLSEIRKSGLTFAIETPVTDWQKSVNKLVEVEKIIEIITVAKKRGWKLAKFYFMVGLPFVDRDTENQAIAEYLGKIYDATRIGMNINVGTFIPKPHTPFQWVPQLTTEQSKEQLSTLKKMINDRVRGCKVSYHEPFISYLEGLISRGDTRYGEVIEQAYRNGCRLDAWDEHLNRDGWMSAIANAGYDAAEHIFKGFSIGEPLPWDSVSLKVGKQYLKNEYQKAADRELTSRCEESCAHPCGVCGKNYNVQDNKEETIPLVEKKELPQYPIKQVVFTYRREGRALFISHINAMRNWEMSFQRSGLQIRFSQGFNPKPRLEFVNPLSLGCKGDEEVLLSEIGIPEGMTEDHVKEQLQSHLSEGYAIKEVLFLKSDPTGRKESLAQYMQGARYEIDTKGMEPYTSQLRSCLQAKETEQNHFVVETIGETNLVKSVFGKDADKFRIARDIDMTRTKIFAGKEKDDYLTFFRKRQGL